MSLLEIKNVSKSFDAIFPNAVPNIPTINPCLINILLIHDEPAP